MWDVQLVLLFLSLLRASLFFSSLSVCWPCWGRRSLLLSVYPPRLFFFSLVPSEHVCKFSDNDMFPKRWQFTSNCPDKVSGAASSTGDTYASVGRRTRDKSLGQHEIVSHQTRLQTSVWMFLTWPEGQKSKHEPSLNSNTDDVWQLWRLWVWNQLPPKRTVKFQTWSLFVSIPRSLNMLLFDLWSSFPASSRLYVCPGLLQSAAGWKGSRSWFRRNVFHWLREPSIFTRWLVQRSEAGAPLGRQRWC